MDKVNRRETEVTHSQMELILYWTLPIILDIYKAITAINHYVFQLNSFGPWPQRIGLWPVFVYFPSWGEQTLQTRKDNIMATNLSQQLLRQVSRFWFVEGPRLRQTGDDGASSLQQQTECQWTKERGEKRKYSCTTVAQCWAHPVVLHQLPQVMSQSELLWIHLMDNEKERHLRPFQSVEKA